MKWLRSFGHAWNGLKVAVRDELNLKIHLAAAATVVMMGFYFHITVAEWLILLLLMAVVIGMELMNTAIENLTDLVSRERNPLAGKVKDIAAAAVLVVSFISVVIGLLIFAKYIF
jgi:diacylglycerol kinase